jgi:hypothetical protein
MDLLIVFLMVFKNPQTKTELFHKKTILAALKFKLYGNKG